MRFENLVESISTKPSDRKMAVIKKIDAIDPIPEADKIEVCTVGGWKVVAQKGLYQVGDLAVYCEIDSFIPTKVAPWLTKPDHFPKEYNGVKGERLRTVKLRGQISQGMLIPLSEVAEYDSKDCNWYIGSNAQIDYITEGDDLSGYLDIQKWEPAIAANLAGTVKGNFPSFIPKTDQERIQNLTRDLEKWKQDAVTWEVTEKLDGSSMTVYRYKGEFGVCSRNLELKETDGNSFWQAARKYNIENAMIEDGWDDVAFQGELIGPGIQKNTLGLKEIEFRVFNAYDIRSGKYHTPEATRQLCETAGLFYAPVNFYYFVMNETVDSLLEMAEGLSFLGNKSNREGLVFKQNNNSGISFKAISNKWLLKNE